MASSRFRRGGPWGLALLASLVLHAGLGLLLTLVPGPGNRPPTIARQPRPVAAGGAVSGPRLQPHGRASRAGSTFPDGRQRGQQARGGGAPRRPRRRGGDRPLAGPASGAGTAPGRRFL